MKKVYQVIICYKDSNVKKQELWNIIDYGRKDDEYHFVNTFGNIFIVPICNITYIQIRKEYT